MNICELDILKLLELNPLLNQRNLAEMSGHSLGAVNQALHSLRNKGFLDGQGKLTDEALQQEQENTPSNAIILSAGFGMRMVPINTVTPKGLLTVKGEVLIERLIRQLQEVGIRQITVITGFMKESFEYLMDQYGVDLLVNKDYATTNTLHSLSLAAGRIGNTYIMPADIWCEDNPFSAREWYSWYMVSERKDPESFLRVNRKHELVKASDETAGNAMLGIAYILRRDAAAVQEKLQQAESGKNHRELLWEDALLEGGKFMLLAKTAKASEVIEIDTYEQLRDLDRNTGNLRSDAIDIIASVFRVDPHKITDISVMKKGMTNRSFLFSVRGEKYIMRIPGEGTDQLINRQEEARVFQTISGLGLCDDPLYINPDNGYKITRFLKDVRVCDSHNEKDLQRCMKKLKSFHDMGLQVPHSFDIFRQIDFYESLWTEKNSIYKDYAETKAHVLSLIPFLDSLEKSNCLTHIDAVPDNFLFFRQADGSEGLQLTDWEYAGMQDPHVDIAMFCIYSLYDQSQVDRLIDIYFEGVCPENTRTKIYCYIACCGLLWSNWCEYKRGLGVEFGEYSLRQYRYAKSFYRLAKERMNSD